METTNPFAAITAALNILHPEAEATEPDVYELRMLGTLRGILSGYYNDRPKQAEQAAAWDGAASIYATLNPVNPALRARADNCLVRAANTTTDQDIVKRVYLLIDIDPVRPSGMSSTDPEHDAAHILAYEVSEYLRGKGWPRPIWADSGNGAHLLYRIDLPNDDESTQLIKRDLEALDFIFSNEKAKIDTSVYNAARISRLYGTMTCKGSNTAERPHRRSAILDAPQPLETVGLEQLQALADLAPAEPPVTEQHAKINVERWIKKFKIPDVSSKPWKGGKVFVFNKCPWNPEHTNGSAYIVQFANGAIAAGCHHDSCRGKGWAELRDKYEPGWQDREKRSKKSQVDIIVEATGGLELLHDDLDEPFAKVRVDGHKETMPIYGRQFKNLLALRYYNKTGSTPGAEMLKSALQVIEAQAIFESAKHNVELRVAQTGDTVYYDLADEAWQVVTIAADGWGIEECPVTFRRYFNTKNQVVPSHGGDFTRILDFVNLHSEADKALFLIYLVTCLLPDIPRPLVILHGEKGAAKSTAMYIMREVIDPAKRSNLDLSRNQQNRSIVFHRNYMPTFDNLDNVTAEQSNDLCRACTGGGISIRELYTTADERILFFKRCVVLNGINVVASRADLLDRSILFELDRIEPTGRKEESVFQKEFEAAKPEIVGGMFDVLSKAMSIYPTVKLTELPRMADFCRWGYAVAEALGIGGENFMDYYRHNMNVSNMEAISSDPVAVAIMALMDKKEEWRGTAGKLYEQLGSVADVEHINVNGKSWPKSSSSLSRRLTPLTSNLSDAGIKCTKAPSTAKATKNHTEITLKRICKDPQQGNQSVQDGTTHEIPAQVLEAGGAPMNPRTAWLHPANTLPQAESISSDDWEEKEAARLKKLMEDTEF